ncbi:MAG: tyrosine-type recombinase/integrase [Actinobacteria bacterium]|nr:tyrosine-type recombinase/integrase [Actinomycetota bacterium]
MEDPTEPLPSLIEEFVAYERAVGGLAAETLRHRRLHLRTLAAWWCAHRPGLPIVEATTEDLATFLVAEADRGMSAHTRKAETVVLRRFFAWLVLTGRSHQDATVHLRSPRVPPNEIEVYPAAHIRRILEHTAALADPRGRIRHTIVTTLRFTGMRSGELRTLRLDHLDLDAGEARVVGKGSRPRTVVVPPPARPVLAAFIAEVRPTLPDSPLLLVNPHPAVRTAHRGFGSEAIYREVELAGKRAGVPGRHFPHRWRHTYATELVRAGVDISVVQRLLGHRSVTSTVGYTHLAVDDLKAAIARIW